MNKRVKIRMIAYLIKLISFLLLFISFSYSINVSNDFLSDIQKEIKKGINAVQVGNYDQSLKIFEEIIEKLPDHPVGYFLHSAVLHRIMVDYCNFSFEDIFLARVNEAIRLSKEMVDKNKEDPWGYFYLAGAYGFRGIFHSEFGAFSQAFIDGFRGYKKMKQVLELDDSIYDAYYGVGLFHYWINYYKVAWLFGIKADKEQGINEVKIAGEKGFYSDEQAASSLIRIYYNEKKYKKSLAQAKMFMQKYPKYLYCYWYVASCYSELSDFQKELEAYEWLKSYFEKASISSQTALMKVNYHIGEVYKKQGDYQKAKKYLKSVLQTEKDVKESSDEQKENEKMNLVRRYKNLANKSLRETLREIQKQEKKF